MMKTLILTSAMAIAASPAFAGTPCESSKSANAPMSYHAVAAEGTPDIVDTAAGLKDFSTLVAAVKAAGLVDALKGDGPFTVFAPTNAAFAKLPEGTVESLLKPENKQKLTDILMYHVVPGKVTAADVVKVSSAKTLLKDKSVRVKVEAGKVYIDKAQVVKTDVMCGNGVIHVIDSVILP